MGELYQKLRNYTMVPERTFEANLEVAKYIPHIAGCVVECGVWKGGMIAAISEVMDANGEREYFLFDSFEGLPPAQEIDGAEAIGYQKNTSSPAYFDNCRISSQYANEAMMMVGAKTFTITEGWFANTLPDFKFPGPIAFLRLDCDWYASIKICLDELWDKVATGGIVVVDDYFAWDGCRKAVNAFFGNKIILREEDSLCWVVK